MEGSNMARKIDVLDLTIEVLREHEKELDRLIGVLQERERELNKILDRLQIYDRFEEVKKILKAWRRGTWIEIPPEAIDQLEEIIQEEI